MSDIRPGSDPFEQLNDELRGLTVHPLPSAEVRRRGDRMRRRNTALAVAGGVAAIALIATPLAYVANGAGRTDPDPAPPAPSVTQGTNPVAEGWLARIPDDFPLAEGWPRPSDGIEGPDRKVPELDLHVCGKLIPAPTTSVDRMTTNFMDAESRRRELRLFPDDSTAQVYLEQVQGAYAACPRHEHDPGDATIHTLRELDAGENAFRVEVTYEMTGGGNSVRVIDGIRVGNAVLIEDGSASGDVAQAGAEHLEQRSTVVEAMSIFDGSTPSTPEPPSPVPVTEVSDPGSEIPADFPVDLDLVSMEGDGGIREEGSPTARGLGFTQICGRTIWTVPATDRLAATGTGPEFEDAREVRVYPSADEAQAQLASIRTALAECPEEPVGDGVKTFRTLEGDTGYQDSVTWGTSYSGGLGGEIVQVTRVGRAVLGVGNSGEYSIDSLTQAAPSQTALSKKILPAMCLFTEAGCGEGSQTSGSGSSGDAVIGPDGWGELRIGMTVEEMEATGLVTVDPAAGDAACLSFSVKGWKDTVHPNYDGQMHGWVSRRLGLAVLIAQPGMRTPEGIGVGSTVEEVRAAYGELRGSAAYNTPAVDGKSWFFLTDQTEVTAFQLEHAEQDCTD